MCSESTDATEAPSPTAALIGELFRALSCAAQAHSDQRRKGSGEPYVNHLIEVAELLARVAGVDDLDVLRAAVLHDVIEDTEVSSEDLERRFGRRVRDLVEPLTDEKGFAKPERKRRQIERMRTAEPAVRTIKMADLCSNIAALPDDWSRERQADYLDWSERVAAVCAGASPALDDEYRSRLERARARLERT